MKKTLTALVVLCIIGASTANAQHDVRTNFAGLLFNSYTLGYENVINEEMSLGGEIGLFRTSAGDGDNEDQWTGVRISPEFRFYFNPDDDCEGFFVGPYLRYRNSSLKSQYSEFNDSTNEYELVDYKRSNSGVAISLNLGRKWVTDSGFYFSTNFGFGKYIINGDNKYDSEAAEEYFAEFDDLVDELPSIDLRYGLNIGWRFD